MARTYHLSLRLEGQPDIEIRGDFTDEDAAILESYLQQHEQLASSKPIREGISCNLSITNTEENGLSVNSNIPNPDDLSILLHRLRPFILQTEPASFVRVSSILFKSILDPTLRLLIQQQRARFDGRVSQEIMRVTSADVLVNSEKVLNAWLNSHEYHRDPEKREAVEALMARIPNALLLGVMISMLVDKTQAIRSLAFFIEHILGKTTQLRFRVPSLAR